MSDENAATPSTPTPTASEAVNYDEPLVVSTAPSARTYLGVESFTPPRVVRILSLTKEVRGHGKTFRAVLEGEELPFMLTEESRRNAKRFGATILGHLREGTWVLGASPKNPKVLVILGRPTTTPTNPTPVPTPTPSPVPTPNAPTPPPPVANPQRVRRAKG